jgi:glycosyltransferase involved in cell wall biosynthesis
MKKLGVWFPTVKCGTGTDVFTVNLVEELNKRDIRAEITWLPHHAEYLPWSVPIPNPPEWATVAHINTWLHSRFLPRNLPVVATLHHSIHDPKLRPYKGLLKALYHQYWIAPNERCIMQQVQKVTAVSQFVADMAKQTLCDVPIQVIYNGVNTELFCTGNRVRKNGEPFRLLYVGAWKTLKGVDLLAPIMRKLGDDFKLYYTGGVAAQKDKSKMPDNMHDLGRLNREDVIRAMQNSDAFLFPSRSEGHPLVAIEAMACGLPVISMSGSSIIETIQHGFTGFLCPKEDIDEFVNVIKKINTKSFDLPNMKINSRNYVVDNYKTSKTIDGFVAIYLDCIND